MKVSPLLSIIEEMVRGHSSQPHTMTKIITSWPWVVVSSCASQFVALQVVSVPTPSNANGGIVALAGLAAETLPTVSNNRIAQVIFTRVLKPACSVERFPAF